MWTDFSAIRIHSDTLLQCGMEGVGSKPMCSRSFFPLGKKKKDQIMLPALQFKDTYAENQKQTTTTKKPTLNTLKFWL